MAENNSRQLTLFAKGEALPEGFRYQPDLLSLEDEQKLLQEIRQLPFKEFEFHGYTGKRRVVSFGWKYDFSARTLRAADDIPSRVDPRSGYLLSGPSHTEWEHSIPPVDMLRYSVTFRNLLVAR